MSSIDWSSLWKKEDWLAVWIGFFFVLLAFIAPTFIKDITIRAPKWAVFNELMGWVAAHIPNYIGMFLMFLILNCIAMYVMKIDLKKYIPGFIVIFILCAIVWWIDHSAPIRAARLPWPLWALIIGLFISTVLRTPGWLKPAVRTEYYIKVGLVVLGASYAFIEIILAGVYGIIQAGAMLIVVWYAAYFISQKLGLDRQFSAVIATGVSICGVSASIAAGGAAKADPKYVSYTVSIILLCAIPMMFLQAFGGLALGWPDTVIGGWIGGTIDTTPAVVAAGGLVSERAEIIAAVVKMAQNGMIGLAAFFIALAAVLRWERRPGAPRPSFLEIWYRFPKFILGFIVASLLFSILAAAWSGVFAGTPDPFHAAWTFINKGKIPEGVTVPDWMAPFAGMVGKGIKDIRYWYFIFAFLCIGLDTNLIELAKLGGGRPAAAFLISQTLNVIWVAVLAWILWSGIFFPVPIKG